MDIIITANGNLRFIHNDEVSILMDNGHTTITRASHVEPASGYCKLHGECMAVECTAHGCEPLGTARQWAADMAPSGGPVLGPFESRTEALAAEVKWLQDQRGL